VHRVVVYYQTQQDGDTYISPSSLTPFATHLIIAAFHLDDDKTIHLNNVSPDDAVFDTMWTEVTFMQLRGVKVMGMLGGAVPAYFHLTSDFDDYYKLISSCIRTHNLDGLDLDVEEVENYDNIVKLIKQLRQDFGAKFIITLAPVASALWGGANISGFDYSTLEKEHGKQIGWYNAQFYSGFASLESTDDYDKIIANGFPAGKVVAGSLTNPGSDDNTFDEVKSTVKELVKKYGNRFGGVAAWEYFKSQPNPDEPWQWAQTMKMTMVDWKEVLKGPLVIPPATEAGQTERAQNPIAASD